ncbi:hypothetical protein V3C99_018858, partial [Haemonchus contortus]
FRVGWMAVFCRGFTLLLFIHRVLSELDTPPLLDSVKTKTDYYEINVEKMKGMWHNAMIRGLIKARAKELLANLPKIEKIVYNQCVTDAKSTVALAKCAVRVFDARDNAKMKADKEAKQAKKTNNAIVTIKAQRKPFPEPYLGKEIGQNRHEKEKLPKYHLLKGKYYRNPIRPQIRSRHFRLYKPLNHIRVRKMSSLKDPVFRVSPINEENVRILPKYVRKRIRRKRKIDYETAPAKTSLNLRRIALKYIKKLLGKSTGKSNIENLHLIHEHFRRTEKINNYFKRMNEENRRLYEQIALPIDSRTPEVINNAQTAVEQVLEIVNAFAASKSSPGKVSVLSPRLLSLFPEPARAPGKRLLSPTFFSFQKDGYLSLPEVFDIITTNQRYQQLMLDVVLDISGAGAVLEDLVIKMKPEMDELKNVKLPLVEELSQRDANWMRVHKSFNDDQAREYAEKGYTFLDEAQLNLIYSEQDQLQTGLNTTKLGNMSKEEKVRRLENDIREMAALDRPKWPMWDTVRTIRKREVSEGEETTANGSTIATEAKTHAGHEHERINGVLYETFRPIAFTSHVARGGAMEVATLSPQAFISEVAYPEALKLETLSPRAFIASILSPAALIARILSPTALRAEVLSPRALHTWVLSPEALIAEVLTPRFLDPRVLSPEALVIDVLSPGFLSPHVLSSESVGLIILSPNILSPRVASPEKLMVEVLSPHILGGPHTHEEASHEVSEIGSKSETRESTEQEHQEHEAIHHNHGSVDHISEANGIPPSPFPFGLRAAPTRTWPDDRPFRDSRLLFN